MTRKLIFQITVSVIQYMLLSILALQFLGIIPFVIPKTCICMKSYFSSIVYICIKIKVAIAKLNIFQIFRNLDHSNTHFIKVSNLCTSNHCAILEFNK